MRRSLCPHLNPIVALLLILTQLALIYLLCPWDMCPKDCYGSLHHSITAASLLPCERKSSAGMRGSPTYVAGLSFCNRKGDITAQAVQFASLLVTHFPLESPLCIIPDTRYFRAFLLKLVCTSKARSKTMKQLHPQPAGSGMLNCVGPSSLVWVHACEHAT